MGWQGVCSRFGFWVCLGWSDPPSSLCEDTQICWWLVFFCLRTAWALVCPWEVVGACLCIPSFVLLCFLSLSFPFFFTYPTFASSSKFSCCCCSPFFPLSQANVLQGKAASGWALLALPGLTHRSYLVPSGGL